MSTIEKHLSEIPNPAELYESAVTLGVLNVLSGTRHPKFVFSANPDGSRCLRLDDGAGNVLSILFSQAGVFMKGFDHESPMSPYQIKGKIWPGIFTGFPPRCGSTLKKPESIGEGDEENIFRHLRRGRGRAQVHGDDFLYVVGSGGKEMGVRQNCVSGIQTLHLGWREIPD
jgi:hypothetical protein